MIAAHSLGSIVRNLDANLPDLFHKLLSLFARLFIPFRPLKKRNRAPALFSKDSLARITHSN